MIRTTLPIIIILTLMLAGCNAQKPSDKDTKTENTQKEEVTPEDTKPAEEDQAVTDEEDPEEEPEEEATEEETEEADEKASSETTSIDATWNKYVNKDLGFSINIPKKMWDGYGAECIKEENSYRPKAGYVATKIFEEPEKNAVFIAPEYIHQISGAEKVEVEPGVIKTNYTKCDKFESTIKRLREDLNEVYIGHWRINILDMENEKALDTYIKDRYGRGCSFGKKVATEKEDLFDIEIEGDGKSMDEDTECPINYITVLKYSPGKKKLANWDIGQDSTFWADDNTPLDPEMEDSFDFE